MQGDAIRMTLLVTDVFEKLGIPYAVGGSISSSVHGIMRSTMDVPLSYIISGLSEAVAGK
jgi:hypothetical protein